MWTIQQKHYLKKRKYQNCELKSQPVQIILKQ